MTIEDLMNTIDQSLKTHVKTVFLNMGELRNIANDVKSLFEADAKAKEPALPPPAPVPPAPVTK